MVVVATTSERITVLVWWANVEGARGVEDAEFAAGDAVDQVIDVRDLVVEDRVCWQVWSCHSNV